jgi:hypothetical protein
MTILIFILLWHKLCLAKDTKSDHIDEEFGFGIDFSSDYENALNTFLESENLKVGDTHFMGSKAKKGTYMVVAEIII